MMSFFFNPRSTYRVSEQLAGFLPGSSVEVWEAGLVCLSVEEWRIRVVQRHGTVTSSKRALGLINEQAGKPTLLGRRRLCRISSVVLNGTGNETTAICLQDAFPRGVGNVGRSEDPCDAEKREAMGYMGVSGGKGGNEERTGHCTCHARWIDAGLWLSCRRYGSGKERGGASSRFLLGWKSKLIRPVS